MPQSAFDAAIAKSRERHETAPGDERLQQALEPLLRLRQLGRGARIARMQFRIGMMGEEAGDRLAICRRQLFARFDA